MCVDVTSILQVHHKQMKAISEASVLGCVLNTVFFRNGLTNRLAICEPNFSLFLRLVENTANVDLVPKCLRRVRNFLSSMKLILYSSHTNNSYSHIPNFFGKIQKHETGT